MTLNAMVGPIADLRRAIDALVEAKVVMEARFWPENRRYAQIRVDKAEADVARALDAVERAIEERGAGAAATAG